MIKDDRYDSLLKFYLRGGPIPWLWGKAQMLSESDGNPRAESPVGAKGLMQFMDATWLEIMGPGRDPYDPENSIQAYSIYAPRIMTYLATTDLEKMAAAYNRGMGFIKRAGDAWRSKLPKETRDYIARINRYYEQFRNAAV